MNYAGFYIRLLAYNIDMIFYLLSAFILKFLIEEPIIMYGSLAFIILIYEVSFLVADGSATPGRRWVKIAVLDTEGNKLSIIKILIRTVLKPVSLLLAFTGFALIAFREDKRSLHDLIAGSIVVKREDD